MIIKANYAIGQIGQRKAVYKGYCFLDGKQVAVIVDIENNNTNYVLDTKKVFEHVFWLLEGDSAGQAAAAAKFSDDDNAYIANNADI